MPLPAPDSPLFGLVTTIIDTLVDAARRGLSKRNAMLEIARDDVVSDELWNELRAYADATRDFEEDGA